MSQIVDKIYANTSYMDDLTVRMTFNSASIEGNTITIDETRSLLVDDIVPNFRRRVSSREVNELSNLRTAWHYITMMVDQRITIGMMHELHKLVMHNIDEDAGEFKKSQNMVGGMLTTAPEKTPTEILYLLDNLYNGALTYAKTNEDKVRAAIAFHMGYERIHPYHDGNGRTGRLLMNLVLLAEEIAPFVIRAEDKANYYRCLREQDEQGLTDYALECINEELALINAVSK